MADKVRKVNYCYFTVPNRAGQGTKILSEAKDAGVNLLAYSGFPVKGGKAQIDLVTDNMSRVRAFAKKKGWRLSRPKRGFLIQGPDKPGAFHRHTQKLAERKINITAADGISAGRGRYGMMLWVKKKDYARASRALKAR